MLTAVSVGIVTVLALGTLAVMAPRRPAGLRPPRVPREFRTGEWKHVP